LQDDNGDGYGDLAIGAPFEDSGGLDAGAAYVVHGPMGGTISLSSTASKVVGGAMGQNLGLSVSSAGDVDGGGLSDLLVGAPGQVDDLQYTGAAYLYLGPVGCTGTVCASVDNDGDGFSEEQGDCDDTNPFIYPGAEDFSDGIDNDCDGQIDEDDASGCSARQTRTVGGDGIAAVSLSGLLLLLVRRRRR
jgi:hypothetical protein